MRIRLVYISGFLECCLGQDDVGVLDLPASRACMEAIWILVLIGLHAGSVMGVE